MADTGGRDRSHLLLDLEGVKPPPSNDSGQTLLDPAFLPFPSPEKLFGTQPNQIPQQQHQQILETPTPSNFFTKSPTSAQESFAEGFEEAFRKIQGTLTTPINNSPSALKFFHTLLGHLSPNGTAKNFLAQPAQQPTPPSGTDANQQLLSDDGTDAEGGGANSLRLEVPQIGASLTNSNTNNNHLLVSAVAVAAAAAASTAATVVQQQQQQSRNASPLLCGGGSSTVASATVRRGSASPFSATAINSNSEPVVTGTTNNSSSGAPYNMDYHLAAAAAAAHLGQLSPAASAATSAVPNGGGPPLAASGGGAGDFFQQQQQPPPQQLGGGGGGGQQQHQFNMRGVVVGAAAQHHHHHQQQHQQQHMPKDIVKKEATTALKVDGGDEHHHAVLLRHHAATTTQLLNGGAIVGPSSLELRGGTSTRQHQHSAARGNSNHNRCINSNVLYSLQTHLAAHQHHKIEAKGADTGEQEMKKLERKRARNRLAASKCRQRKLQRIMDLEQQVSDERERGAELQLQVGQLQSVIRTLEEQLIKANNSQQQQQQMAGPSAVVSHHRQNNNTAC